MNVTEQFTWVIAVEGKFNMNWIGPLFTNAAGWSAYVSYKDGVWYVDKENPIKIGEGKSGMMLLPIMEKGYGENYEYQLSLLREGLESRVFLFMYRYYLHLSTDGIIGLIWQLIGLSILNLIMKEPKYCLIHAKIKYFLSEQGKSF